jgi:hypothetical protein
VGEGICIDGLEEIGLSDVHHREEREANLGMRIPQAEPGRSQRPFRTFHDLHALPLSARTVQMADYPVPL